MAEAMLRAASGADDDRLTIASASLGPERRPIHPTIVRLLAERGLAPPKTISDPVHTGLVDGADLILTMTGAHAIAMAGRFRQATRRVFTLDHGAQVLPARGNGSLDGWLEQIERIPRAYPQQPGSVDIVDPVNRPDEVFEHVAREIERRCEQLAVRLSAGATR